MDIEVQLIVDGRKLRVMPDLYTRMVDIPKTIPQEIIDEVRALSKLPFHTPTGCAFCAFRGQRTDDECPIFDKINAVTSIDCGDSNLTYVDPSEVDAYNVAKTILGAQS